MIENLYSARAAARRLGISIPTITRKIKAGKLAACRIQDSKTKNLRYAILESALENYLKNNL